jgi:hypothetical protein
VIDALARVGDDHHAMRADHGESGLIVGALSGTVPLAAREEVAMTESVKFSFPELSVVQGPICAVCFQLMCWRLPSHDSTWSRARWGKRPSCGLG